MKHKKMNQRYIDCRYNFFVDIPQNTYVMVLGFILSLSIIVSGIILNANFFIKLKEQKSRRQVGRKGNVIEPLMKIFCVFQMIYWPMELIFMWVNTNGIISSYQMPTWLLYLFYELIRFGRTYIATNSIFIALIRFLYIVHQRKLNQYDFENVGKVFQALSIITPLAVELVSMFSFSGNFCQLKSFNDDPMEFSSTQEFIQKETVEWTLRYLPRQIVYSMALFYVTTKILIVSNILEVLIYAKIFRSIER